MIQNDRFVGKKLLILGGIQMACDIVKSAQAMGAYVVVADYLEDSPAKKIADEAVLINALDVDAIVDFCRKEHVNGVTTGFVDILLQPCYEVCQRLGLPCYLTSQMIELSTNKIAFKEACKKYKDVYFITTTNATSPDHYTSVDGTHPGDYGYTLWARSIRKPVLRILKKYGIR